MENQKKKILIFSLAYHPFVGGAEVAIKEITDRLGDDFVFDMVTVNLDGQQDTIEMIGNINIYRVGRGKLDKYLFPWLAFRRAEYLHEQNNYDAVWGVMANQAGWAAMKFKRRHPRVKFLLTLQEGDSEWDIWLRTWFIRPLYKNIYRQADYIQAISNFLADRAKKLGAQSPVAVVPNGISVLNEELGIKKQGRRTVFTASRLVKKNGIGDLIEAMKNVEAKLIIAGDGGLKKKLETRAINLGMKKISGQVVETDKVIFLGQINNFEVYDELRQADVFVRPSLSEGLGNAFLEAMSMGVPTIGTRVGGIPDFLREGETGWFCEVKNPQSIAEKINYVLDDKNKDEVNRVAQTAKQLVTEKYNWNVVSKEMKNIFYNLVKN